MEHYRHVSLGASFPGVDTPLLYPYWDAANKEVSASAGSIGLSRRTTAAEPSRRPTSTSAITSTRHSPDQIHRASLPMLVDNNSVLRRTSSGVGPLTPPTPSKIPISNGDPSHNAHSYCEAVYSFKAEYPGELSLQVWKWLVRVWMEREHGVLVIAVGDCPPSVCPHRGTAVSES